MLKRHVLSGQVGKGRFQVWLADARGFDGWELGQRGPGEKEQSAGSEVQKVKGKLSG